MAKMQFPFLGKTEEPVIMIVDYFQNNGGAGWKKYF